MRRILPLNALRSRGYHIQGYDEGSFKNLTDWAFGAIELNNYELARSLNGAFLWDYVRLDDNEDHIWWTTLSSHIRSRDVNLSERARNMLKIQVLYYFTEEAGPSTDQLAEEEDLEGFE